MGGDVMTQGQTHIERKVTDVLRNAMKRLREVERARERETGIGCRKVEFGIKRSKEFYRWWKCGSDSA